jgi:hypothetical protein
MLSLVAAWLVNIAHFLKLNKSIDGVERFRAKVRVKKTRQIRNREPRFVSIETEKQGSRARETLPGMSACYDRHAGNLVPIG